MLDKLESIKTHWEEVGIKLSDPSVVSDMNQYSKLSKEYKDLGEIVATFDKYKEVLSNIENNKEIVKTESDPEFKEMAQMEINALEPEKTKLEEEIKMLLIPKDPSDHKDIVLEIRAGTGGDEASIFAGDLFSMYSKFFDTMGWKMEVMNTNLGTSGGYKEIVAEVSGDSIYGIMKYESGVHRVQRVPKTETQGRVHTSAATVAVMPQADEVDVVLKTDDIRIDTFRASGAGGQHVNKTESAVRLTHIPSGVVVECQEGRSQIKNKEIAMKMLRTRLYESKVQEQHDKISKERKTLVSTGDRSAKIRTYNYPQGRVTDHRINLTLYNLDAVMNGDVGGIIESLRVAENAEKLKES